MVKKKKKEKKNISTGIAHINSSFNNTKVLISDVQGNAIAWSSSGTMGFKGSRKATPYAAQLAAEDAGKKVSEPGQGNGGAVQGEGERMCPSLPVRTTVHVVMKNGLSKQQLP